MSQDGRDTALGAALNDLYDRYNRTEFVHPDPLEFLHRYTDPLDREIVAVVAASLAYGRVAQILNSVERVLERIPEPRRFLERTPAAALRKLMGGLKHRFTKGQEISDLLTGIKRVNERFGSLGECFRSALLAGDETALPALAGFVDKLRLAAPRVCPTLLSSPRDGSACKRMCLLLRWMVRHDGVDPGGWAGVGAGRLVIPLDTHVFRIGRALGLIRRRQADMRAALEMTSALKAFAPEDPVRYDFALSRLGIRGDADPEEYFRRYGVWQAT